MTVGQIISGNVESVDVRQKSGEPVELGELFVVRDGSKNYILQCYEIEHRSQIGEISRELIAGMKVEGYEDIQTIDKDISYYIIAKMKVVAIVNENEIKIPKSPPKLFSSVERITEDDIRKTIKKSEIHLGKLRSGSRELDIQVKVPLKTLPHHTLISATTGRGKSFLAKLLASSVMKNENCGLLIFDPHDEYYGRNEKGLKDFSEGLSYYSLNPPAGCRTLVINTSTIKPWHFSGVSQLSMAQIEAMYTYYNQFSENWISEILNAEKPLHGIKQDTLDVLKRKLKLLGMGENSAFSFTAGEKTVKDIINDLEENKTVIVDTSALSNEIELIIASIISCELFAKYKRCKITEELKTKPAIGILIEEAPRVIGTNALASGGNIFTTIAREGRKFKTGLIAITQLPSLIPKEILANMNTKIILGTELSSERNALIESASQDLSKDSRNIASLGKAEAIVSSSFVPFAMPIKIPDFRNFIKKEKQFTPGFTGVSSV